MSVLWAKGGVSLKDIMFLSVVLEDIDKKVEELLMKTPKLPSDAAGELRGALINLRVSQCILSRSNKCSINELAFIVNTFNDTIPTVSKIVENYSK
jgi:hypothetical protein